LVNSSLGAVIGANGLRREMAGACLAKAARGLCGFSAVMPPGLDADQRPRREMTSRTENANAPAKKEKRAALRRA
jgi:hypothetical protein